MKSKIPEIPSFHCLGGFPTDMSLFQYTNADFKDMADISIVSTATNHTSWCVPSHGILAGCSAPGLSAEWVALHTNIALVVCLSAAFIDVANLFIRVFHFKDKQNVFMTCLYLLTAGSICTSF